MMNMFKNLSSDSMELLVLVEKLFIDFAVSTANTGGFHNVQEVFGSYFKTCNEYVGKLLNGRGGCRIFMEEGISFRFRGVRRLYSITKEFKGFSSGLHKKLLSKVQSSRIFSNYIQDDQEKQQLSDKEVNRRITILQEQWRRHRRTLNQKCWIIFGFLCSPAHRIAVKLVASLYPSHMEWARFADGRTTIGKATVFGTRALEVVAADRSVVQFVHKLRMDWSEALPVSYTFMQSESRRAVSLGLCKTAEEYENIFQDRMNKGIEPMESTANTYFVQPHFNPGLVPLQLYCPATAPYCASALLECLWYDGYVYGPIPPPPCLTKMVYPHLSIFEMHYSVTFLH